MFKGMVKHFAFALAAVETGEKSFMKTVLQIKWIIQG